MQLCLLESWDVPLVSNRPPNCYDIIMVDNDVMKRVVE
jgi:hypothetical protein